MNKPTRRRRRVPRCRRRRYY